MFGELDQSRAVSALSRFVESCEPVTVSFRGVETFDQPDGVIFSAPRRRAGRRSRRATRFLIHAIGLIAALSARPLDPHTLAQQVPAHLFDAAAVPRGAFEEFDANLFEIGLVEYAPVRTLWRRRLAA